MTSAQFSIENFQYFFAKSCHLASVLSAAKWINSMQFLAFILSLKKEMHLVLEVTENEITVAVSRLYILQLADFI